MEAIRMRQIIQKRGELTIRNLPIEQGQHVEILVLFTPSELSKRPRLTARQLLESEIIGLWSEHQVDIDSVAYARQLREQAQRRSMIDGGSDDHA